MNNVSLNKLMDLVAERYTCEPENYPDLANADAAEKLRFEIRHSVLHFSKSAGALAGISEAVDHGEALNTEAIRKLAPKALINALKLALLVGVSAEDLAAECDRILREVNAPQKNEKAA